MTPTTKEELRSEEKRARLIAGRKAFRKDANSVKPKSTKIRLADTPQVLAQRLRVKLWTESHKDLAVANQKKQYAKRVSESKRRIQEAIAQADATQRNVDKLADEIFGGEAA